MKYHKKLNCYSYETVVDFKGIPVKLFFCRMGKRSSWHGLLTTNTQLTFEKAFEIYATRWTIEVFSRNVNNICVWASANRLILTHKSLPQRSRCCNTTCFRRSKGSIVTKVLALCFGQQSQKRLN